MRILLDCHEVLADFAGQALRIHGHTWDSARRLPGYRVGQRDLEQTLGISAEGFWLPINRAGKAFWATLPKLPNADELLALVEDVADEWYIVSSPSRHHTSWSGIRLWAQQHLGVNFMRLVLTNYKHLMANPNTILIDDSEANVSRFLLAGGEAILYPSLANKLCVLAQDRGPITFTKTRLRHLQEKIDGVCS